MILNKKAIDAINKAKNMLVIRKKLYDTHDRAWSVSKEATDPCHYDPVVRNLWLKVAKIDHDLRQIQQTILIHLGVVKD
jgi:hypothetical protein